MTLGPLIALSAPELHSAVRSQSTPSSASDGYGYLTAWIDGRGGVRATRIDAMGTPLDPAGLAITSRDAIAAPLVAFDGTAYTVFYGTGMIRIGRDGRILAQDRTIDLPSHLYPAITDVATNGTVFLVSWVDYQLRGPWESHVAVVSLDGDVRHDELSEQVALATDGIGFVSVGLTADRQLVATRYDGDGRTVESGIPIQGVSSVTYAAELAWNGDHYLLARGDAETTWTQSLDRSGHSVGTPHSLSGVPLNSLAAAGGEFLLGWTAEATTADDRPTTNVHAIHLDADGSPVESEPISIAVGPAAARGPALASNGSTYLVVWEERAHWEDVDSDVWGNVLGRSASETEPVLLALSASEQRAPAIAASTTGMLVAWWESRSRGYDVAPGIVFVRTGARGAARDASPVIVAPNGTDLSVGTDGHDFLVAWREGNYNVSVAFVPQSGEPKGRLVLDPGFGFQAPAVAFGDGSYLVAWQSGDADAAILVARVAPDGSLIESPRRIASGLHVAAAFDGRDFLVIHDAWPGGLVAERLTPSLGHVDSSNLDRNTSIAAAPGIACHDGNCLVAWMNVAQERREISAVVVGRESMSFTFPVSDEREAVLDLYEGPAVAWMDGAFVIAWSEAEGDGPQLVARRVRPDGTYAGTVFNLTSGPEASRLPRLAAATGRDLAVVWERTSPEAEYGNVPRAFLRLVGFHERHRPVRR